MIYDIFLLNPSRTKTSSENHLLQFQQQNDLHTSDFSLVLGLDTLTLSQN